MTQLFFRYGVMNSGKTLDLLKVAHNYEEQGKKIIILSPEIDTRSHQGFVESRIGLKHQSILIHKNESIINKLNHFYDLDCILVDESQFFLETQIDELLEISKSIPVICYGLRTDFTTHSFEGSKRLLEIADKIEEIKTTCYFCNKKATMNLLIDKKTMKPIYSGNQIHIGNQEFYPVCKDHYFNLNDKMISKIKLDNMKGK